MNYPPIYHEASRALVDARPRTETRQKVARALRWIRANRGRREARAERRLFIYTAPEYFTRTRETLAQIARAHAARLEEEEEANCPRCDHYRAI